LSLIIESMKVIYDRLVFFVFLDSEIVKPALDPTIRILKAYAPKILSIEVDRLLQEVKITIF
jgi:hypothetical protein